MYKVTWEIPNIPEQTGQGGLGSLCLDVDTPVALSPSRGGGELASGPTRPVHGAGETLPNRMPRHAPPWSSLCPALPWVEQGWARRQSHLGPGAGRCAPPDPMRKVLHHLQKETLGCPSSPCCPARGPGAQGQQGQASPSFRAGAEPPRAGPYFQGPGQHSAPHGLQGEHRMQG